MTDTVPAALQAVFERERADARRAVAGDADAVRAQVIRMYSRIEREQAAVIAVVKPLLACKLGCNYCCHQRVELRPYEAFVLAEHIRSRLTAARQANARQRLAAIREQVASLTAQQHTQAGIPCALLEDGVCSIYEGRPATCRKYYSVSVETCRNAFNDTSAPLTGQIEDEQVRLAGNAVALGYAKGLEDAGYDATLYELHDAVYRALTNSKAEKRYRDGKKPFV